MHNFFANEDQFKDNKVFIRGNDYNHIANVLRMKTGDNFFVSNKDSGESYLTVVKNILNDEVECEIIEKKETRESNVKVTLYQGLPKSDKMELIIQKSIELGVSKIVPVDMKYCIAKLNNEDKKIARWQTISESAAKQSKRNIIPKIEGKISFKQMLNEFEKYDLVILAYENEDKTNLKQVLSQNKACKSIAIIVGPEGGLSEDEVKETVDLGGKCVSLGKRILRTETAPLALLSMIMYEYEF